MINSTLASSAADAGPLSAAAVPTHDVVACLITHSNSTSSLGHSSSLVMATKKISMPDVILESHHTKIVFLFFLLVHSLNAQTLNKF